LKRRCCSEQESCSLRFEFNCSDKHHLDAIRSLAE
jgi:hypothetical protein